ncbi:hypothetical protein PVT68_16755 [Microbulbifer bruguierae]|uniref:Glycosyl transferase family 2 n=1 Tax=Microbulbifer bruguierae TaxID=3029061 RepID=A0ABY8NE90_9GAMM|nr:hypothetical protein [Microbulbifer bruguierae]WGL16402.1 hypothetical protein PVT68_16755 [Microbulbifer bruguierae]
MNVEVFYRFFPVFRLKLKKILGLSMTGELAEVVSVPKTMGKTGVKDLAEVTRHTFEGVLLDEFNEGLYTTEIDGFNYDFFWKPKKSTQDRLFVLFSGDALRSKNDPPVFQRWSWADHFPGHVVYFSDPSLYLSPKLGLAWYAGTKNHDPMVNIAEILGKICTQLDLDSNQLVSYGSSGGGFAALRLGLFLPEISTICINPQVDITKYGKNLVERYLRTCLELEDRAEALELYPDRINLIENIDKLAKNRIIYVQNVLDEDHYEIHFKLFRDALTTSSEYSDKRFSEVFFSHGEGHKAAETTEAFNKAISLLS